MREKDINDIAEIDRQRKMREKDINDIAEIDRRIKMLKRQKELIRNLAKQK